MPALELQQQFFERLKSITPHEQLVANVSEVLDVSVSEAYKKISGRSLINIEQIQLLCNKFKVSFEYNPAQSGSKVLFSYSNLFSGKDDIEKYLDNLYNNLVYIKSSANGYISCTTDDIPVFHLFQYPELAAFKLFFWQNRIHANKKSEPFSVQLIDKKLTNKCLLIHKEYMSIPGSEIWTKSSLLNTLYQIEYVVAARLIKEKELMIKLCDQLQQTIMDVADYAVDEAKSDLAGNKVAFKWYFCENIGSTTYLANVNDSYYCYQRFNTFNNLQTDDAAYCNEVNFWIQSLIKESICVSGQGEKYRNTYIEETIKSIEEIRNRF
ncbi:MAG: hypothetical protein ABIN97_19605 [Ginsengibacter sp.]